MSADRPQDSVNSRIPALAPAPVIALPRNVLWYKWNGLLRAALARNFRTIPGQHLVNEYPKSGGTWLAQMLSSYSGIPYPRLRLPRVGANVLHAHYCSAWGTNNAVVVWRDPRDVLVSHFFHVLHLRGETSRRNTLAVRRRLGMSNVESVDFNRHFLGYYELVMSRAIHPRFTWCDFFDNWFDRSEVVHTSYERLQADAAVELERIGEALQLPRVVGRDARSVVEAHAFELQSGRRAGQSDDKAFLRKGIIGDWRERFGPEILARIEADFGDRIARYESSALFPQIDATSGAPVR